MRSAITHLIAGVPVSGLDAGIDWYTRFFGRPPDLRGARNPVGRRRARARTDRERFRRGPLREDSRRGWERDRDLRAARRRERITSIVRDQAIVIGVVRLRRAAEAPDIETQASLAANGVADATVDSVPDLEERSPFRIDVIKQRDQLGDGFLGARAHGKREARDRPRRLRGRASCRFRQRPIAGGERVEDLPLACDAGRRRLPLASTCATWRDMTRNCGTDSVSNSDRGSALRATAVPFGGAKTATPSHGAGRLQVRPTFPLRRSRGRARIRSCHVAWRLRVRGARSTRLADARGRGCPSRSGWRLRLRLRRCDRSRAVARL
jgi:hypothetical protein